MAIARHFQSATGLALLLGLIPVNGHADSLTYTSNLAPISISRQFDITADGVVFQSDYTGWPALWAQAGFDPALGTLNGIQISIRGTETLSGEVISNSDRPVNFAQASATVDLIPITHHQWLLPLWSPVSCLAPDFSIQSGKSFSFSASHSADGSYMVSSAPGISAGFPIGQTVAGIFSFSASYGADAIGTHGYLNWALSPDASATVSYLYTPAVPEVSTLTGLLLGLPLLLVPGVRKRAQAGSAVGR